jgi:hypothetical protein
MDKSSNILIDDLEYSFLLIGKPVSNELLMVQATALKDNKFQRKDSIVPLKCKWFYTNQDNPSLREIPDNTGCFY